MKLRIFLGIMGATLISLAALAFPLGRQIFASVTYQTNLELTAITVEAARNVPADFYLPGHAKKISPKKHVTFSLYDAEGKLISGEGPIQGDNVVRKALKNRITHFERADNLYVAIPLFQDKELRGALRGAALDRIEESKIRSKIILMAVEILLALLIGLFIAYFVSRKLAQPINLLSEAATRIGSEMNPHLVPKLSVPELDAIARSINISTIRIAQLLARERAYSSEASHQLRTPIAGIKANIEAELQFPRENTKEVLNETLLDINQLEETVTELLALARQEKSSDKIQVEKILTQTFTAWKRRFEMESRELQLSIGEGLVAKSADPIALRHALDVLLDNALTHGTGKTTIDYQVIESGASIRIQNEGKREVNASSPQGLGLTLAKRLIERMEGTLELALEDKNPYVIIKF